MAVVYVLYSKSLDRYYVGSCKDLEQRLNEHLLKKYPTSYTARADDWKLFFSRSDIEYGQARRIELHIKRMKSRKYIQDLALHDSIFMSLIEKYK